jgi:hypothetical protein
MSTLGVSNVCRVCCFANDTVLICFCTSDRLKNTLQLFLTCLKMNMEDEMNRFEAEIGGGMARSSASSFIGASAFHAMQARLAAAAAASNGLRPRPMGIVRPPVMPVDQAYIQSQIHARAGLPPPSMTAFSAPPIMTTGRPVISSGPSTISAPPQTSSAALSGSSSTQSQAEDDEEDILAKLQKYEAELKKDDEPKKKKKKKNIDEGSSKASSASVSAASTSASVTPVPSMHQLPPPPVRVVPSVPPPTSAGASFNRAQGASGDDSSKKAKKQKRIIRAAGGQLWEDDSLRDWDTNDFRLFCGDLGNDVTDEVLVRYFGRYPSFQRAKVIRDKRSNKTKGYGFVSFKDPVDFTKAMREMNGKYVGSRPIKLRKSNWKDRNIEVVKHKQKVKQQMGYKW